MLLVSVAAPMVVAASRVQPFSDAAHDEAVARALGHGFAGALRALDVVVASLFLWLPLGTRASRAGLASAGMAGVAGGLLYVLARRLLAGTRRAPVTNAAVAALGSLSASLSGAFIVESSAAGSSMPGAVLALIPVVLVSGSESAPWPAIVGAASLALSYEPLVGLIAVAGVAGCLLGRRTSGSPTNPSDGAGRGPSRGLLALAALAGSLPFALSWAWGRGASERLGASAWASLIGEGTRLGPSGAL
jgi:hypothetical protein